MSYTECIDRLTREEAARADAYLKGLADALEYAAAQSQAAPAPQAPQDARRARLRARIVREIWDVDLRRDLADRLADLVALGIAAPSELERALKGARRKAAKTGAPVWQPLATWCRSRWESAGREWVATSPILEPEPPARRSVDPTDDDWEPPTYAEMAALRKKQAEQKARRNRAKGENE